MMSNRTGRPISVWIGARAATTRRFFLRLTGASQAFVDGQAINGVLGRAPHAGSADAGQVDRLATCFDIVSRRR